MQSTQMQCYTRASWSCRPTLRVNAELVLSLEQLRVWLALTVMHHGAYMSHVGYDPWLPARLAMNITIKIGGQRHIDVLNTLAQLFVSSITSSPHPAWPECGWNVCVWAQRSLNGCG
jgi:hypothetical protein